MMRKRFRQTILCALLSFTSFTVVLAQTNYSYAKTTDKSLKKKLNKATSLYDEIELEDAEDVLTDAISEAASNNIVGLTVAKLHVMLGIIRYASSGEEDAAEEQFVEAVRADASIDIPGVYRTPILEKILKRAQAKVPKNSGSDKKPIDPSVSFSHEVIKTADSGKDLKLSVQVPAEMPVFKMFVHMRRFQENDFTKYEMVPTDGTTFSVTLPGDDVYTSQIDYFIIAEDRSGGILARSGDVAEPNNVVVMGSGSTKRKKSDDKKDDDPNSDSENEKIVFFDLSAGTGLGFLPGGEANSPTANPTRDVSPGIAPAFGHANIGFGAFLNKNMQLGLEFRIQFAPTQNFSDLEDSESLSPGGGFWDTKVPCFGLGLPVDCMARLKYKYLFTDSIFYSSVGAGLGRVRNWLRLQEPATRDICTGRETHKASDGKEYCLIRDTVRTGWAHFGMGGGMMFPLSDSFALYLDTFLMVIFPETSINLDVQGGAQIRF